MNDPAWLQWLACLAVPAVLIAISIRESKRRYDDPPLPTADATYIPSDGDEGDGKGYYAREQRAMRKADAIQQRMGASGRLTSERLHYSNKRLRESKSHGYDPDD